MGPMTKAEAEEKERKTRDAVAFAEFKRWHNTSVRDLTWGDVRALGYITAGVDELFART